MRQRIDLGHYRSARKSVRATLDTSVQTQLAQSVYKILCTLFIGVVLASCVSGGAPGSATSSNGATNDQVSNFAVTAITLNSDGTASLTLNLTTPTNPSAKILGIEVSAYGYNLTNFEGVPIRKLKDTRVITYMAGTAPTVVRTTGTFAAVGVTSTRQSVSTSNIVTANAEPINEEDLLPDTELSLVVESLDPALQYQVTAALILQNPSNAEPTPILHPQTGKNRDVALGNNTDSDTYVDADDNCPGTSNEDQLDTDGDGEGDVCDTDDDGDEVSDLSDNCPFDHNPDQVDTYTSTDGGTAAGDACELPLDATPGVRNIVVAIPDSGSSVVFDWKNPSSYRPSGIETIVIKYQGYNSDTNISAVVTEGYMNLTHSDFVSFGKTPKYELGGLNRAKYYSFEFIAEYKEKDVPPSPPTSTSKIKVKLPPFPDPSMMEFAVYSDAEGEAKLNWHNPSYTPTSSIKYATIDYVGYDQEEDGQAVPDSNGTQLLSIDDHSGLLIFGDDVTYTITGLDKSRYYEFALILAYDVPLLNLERDILLAASMRAAITLPPVPAPPSGLVGTASPSGISLDWDDADGATSYNVSRFGFAGFETTAAVSNYTDSTVSVGNQYTYSIVACNRVGCSDAATVTVDYSVPASPIGLVGAAGPSGISLDWDDVFGADNYTISRSDRSSGAATTITAADSIYIDSTVPEGSQYTYSIVACNRVGCSDASAAVVVDYSVPASPIGLVGTASPSGISLDWEDASDAEYYTVRRDGVLLTSGATLTESSFADSGLVLNRSYSYELTSCNQVGCPDAATVTVDYFLPGVPSGLVASASVSGISLDWDDASAAEYYTVHRDGRLLTSGATLTESSFADSGLVLNHSYSYEVTACNQVGCSDASASVVVDYSVPASPIGLVGTASPSGISLDWEDASDAEYYTVRRDGVLLTSGATLTESSFADSGLVLNRSYSYELTSCNQVGCPDAATVTVDYFLPGVPSGLVASASVSGISLDWDDASAAEYYTVHRDGRLLTSGATLTESSFADSGLVLNRSYSYELTSCNQVGCSDASATVMVDYSVPTSPSGLVRTAGPSGISLDWDNVVGATSYKVSRLGLGGFATTAAVSNYTDSTVSVGNQYIYSVVSCNDIGCSAAVTVAVDYSVPAVPSGLVASASVSGISLDWDDASAAEYYTVRRDGRLLTSGATLTENSFADSGLVLGRSYRYEVTACNQVGCSAAVTVVVDYSVPVIPIAGDFLTSVFDVTDGGDLELFFASSVTTAVVGGITYLFVAGFQDDGVSVFSVNADGSLTSVYDVTDTGDLELDGALSVTTAVVGGITYLFVAGYNDDGVSVFRVNAGGSLTSIFDVTDDGSLQLGGAWSVTTAVVGGITYLFVAGWFDDGVSVFRVNTDGSLTSVFDVTDGGDLQLDGARSVTTAVVGGRTYLFVAGSSDSGVSVFSVNAGGSLTSVFDVTDTGDLELRGANSVTTAVIGDSTYLFVAGFYDDGVSVFSVNADGPLTSAYDVTDTGDLELDGARSVTTAVVGSITYLFVAGAYDDGVSVFSVTPPFITWSVVNGAILLDWEDVAAAEYYTVRRDGVLLTSGATLTESSFTDGDPVLGSSYSYEVTACNPLGCSDAVTVMIDYSVPEVPSGLLGSASTSGMSLDWNDVVGATSYKVSRLGLGGFATTAADSTYIDSTVSVGNQYIYSIMACNDIGCSTAAAVVIDYSVPASPSGLVGTASPSGISLDWDDAVGADNYTISRSDRSSGVVTTTIAASTYSDSIVLEGAQYTYSIVACNDIGCSAAAAVTIDYSVPAVPSGLVGSASPSGISLDWDDVDGTDNYKLSRNGLDVIIADSNYTDSGVMINNAYEYQVAACNRVGCSAAVTVAVDYSVPASPSGLVGSVSPSGISLDWEDVAVAEYYTVRRDGRLLTSGATLTESSFADSGLVLNRSYSYEVTACNQVGCSTAAAAVVVDYSVPFIPIGGSLTSAFDVTDGGDLELFGASSVTTAEVGGITYLFAAGLNDDGVSVFRVNAGGSLTSVFDVADNDDLELNGAFSVTTAEVNGITYLFVAGAEDDGVSVFRVGTTGALTNVDNVADDGPGGSLELDGANSVTTAEVGGITYLFVAGWRDDGVSVFRVNAGGSLTSVFDVADNDDLELNGAFSVTTAEVNGITYLFVAGLDDDGVSVFRVNAVPGYTDRVSLENVANVDDSDSRSLELYGASSVTTVVVGGITYLFAAGLSDDGVSVFRVNAGGSLTSVFDVTDNDDLELDGARSVTTAEVGGITYLFVAGEYDSGVSVFSVNAGGSLTSAYDVNDNDDLELRGAISVTTEVIGGITYLFVAGFYDSGVSVFRVNLPPTPITWSVVNGAVLLDWEDVAVAEYYTVRRDSRLLTSGAPLTESSFTDSGLVLGRSYSYEVTACNQVGCSAASAAVVVDYAVPFIPAIGSLTSVYDVDDSRTLELDGAQSVTTAVVDGRTYLFVAGRLDNGVSVFRVNAVGSLTSVFDVTDGDNLELDGATSVTTAVVGGSAYLFAAGYSDDGVSVFRVNAGGSLTSVANVDDSDNSAYELDGAVSVTTAVVGGITYLFVAGVVDDGVSVFRVNAVPGYTDRVSLENVANVADTGSLQLDGAASVTTAEVGGHTYLFVAGLSDDGVSVFRVNDGGSLTNVDNVDDSANSAYELDFAQSVTTAEVGGSTYLFAAGGLDSGVSVFRVNADGSLTNVDNVADGGDLELYGAASVTTAEVGGHTYLFVAGWYDNGVSVFRVNADGSLTNVDNVTDGGDLELWGARSVTTAVIGGIAYLFVAGRTDDGVSVFRVNIPPITWSVVNGAIILDWPDVSGAEYYTVRRDGVLLTSGAPLTESSFTDSDLVLGRSYSYEVTACNKVGCSDAATVTVDYSSPAVPSGLTWSVANGDFSLDWDNVVGATSYKVSRLGLNGFATTVADSNYTDSTVSVGNQYIYSIMACNDIGCSAAAAVVIDYSVPASLNGLVGTASPSGISLDWDDAVGADNYTISRSGRNSGVVTTTIAASTYSDSTVLEGAQYTYSIVACNDIGCSAAATVTIDYSVPAVPSGLVGSVANGDISLDWDDVADATFYTIGFAGFETTATVSSYMHSALNKGRYTYSVSACNQVGCSAAVTVAVDYSVPTVPSGLVASASASGISLDWDDADGATSYKVSRIGLAGFATTVTRSTYSDSSVSVGNQYTYSVMACNDIGCSSAAAVMVDYTVPFIPIGGSLTSVFDVTDSVDLELVSSRSVTTAVVGGITYLFATDSRDDGVSVFRVNAGGSLTSVFSVTDDGRYGNLELGSAGDVTTAEVGGITYLFVAGYVDDGVSVFRVNADGSLASVYDVTDSGSLELDGPSSVTTEVVSGITYLFVAGSNDDGVSVFRVNAGGSLTSVFDVTDSVDLELDFASSVTTAEVGGNAYLFVAGRDDDGVSVFSVNAGGSLTGVFDVADGGSLELDGAHSVTTAVVGGITYLFAAGRFDDGVSVFRVNVGGSLTSVYDVTDGGSLELDGAYSVTTEVIGGITYLFAAGLEDDGVSVFRVNADGSLTSAYDVTDGGDLELDGASSLTTAEVGGITYLFVGGFVDDGVSVFSVTPPPLITWSVGNAQILLDWEDVAVAEYYTVRRDGSLLTSGTTLTESSFADSGLVLGRSYSYEVTACNQVGCSDASAAVVVDYSVPVIPFEGSLTSVFDVTDRDGGSLELDGAFSVTTAEVGGTTYLFVAGRYDNGVSVFRVDADGFLTSVFDVTDNDALELDGAFSLTTAVVGGITYLFVAGFDDDGVSVFRVASNGALTNVYNIDDSDGSNLELDGVQSVTTAEVGVITYLFVAGNHDDGVSVFRVNAGGSLTSVYDVADDDDLELEGASSVTTTVVGGNTYLFVAGYRDDGVIVFRVNVGGSLTSAYDVTDGGDLELRGATSVTTAVVSGMTYLFVAGAVDDGVSVFRIGTTGALTNVDNVDDSANSAYELNDAYSVTTAEVGGITYLFVAGYRDDGVSVFRVNAGGSLTSVFDVTDGGSLELDGAFSVTTAVVGGRTYLFAAGQIDDGVSVFSVAPPVTWSVVNRAILLNWGGVAAAEYYTVRRYGRYSSRLLTSGATLTESSYIDKSAALGSSYRYEVTACNPLGCGTPVTVTARR